MRVNSSKSAPAAPLGLRVFNRIRGLLTTCGVPQTRLEIDALKQGAGRKTGLEDFGDDSYEEPFRRLLQAYNTESNLTEFGRLFARINLRMLLVNRLRMQQVLKSHPEILEERISHPFVIAGLPRTGTSLLYNLMAQDPANRPLLFWESLSPVPNLKRSSKRGDPRIKTSKLIVNMLKRLAPKMMSIHPLDATGPEECSRLLLNTFVTPFAAMENHIPGYVNWYLNLPIERLELAYQDYCRQLQVLQWQNPPQEQWLLKSPSHLLGLEPLRRVFPDVRLIQTHRDPHKVVPSACSLVAAYQNISSDRVDPHAVGQEVLKLLVEGTKRSLTMHRSEYSQQTFHLQYKELMADPIGVLHQLYKHFGSQLSPAAESGAKRWLAENPANKHGTHRYSVEEFGLSAEQIDSAFAEYTETFQIPREQGSLSQSPVAAT